MLVSVGVGLRFQKKFIEIEVLDSIIVSQKKKVSNRYFIRKNRNLPLFIDKGPPIKIGSQVSLKKAFLKKMHSGQ